MIRTTNPTTNRAASRIATFTPWFARCRSAALAAPAIAIAVAVALVPALELPAAAGRIDPLVIVLPATGRGVSTTFVEQARWMLVQRLSGRAGVRVLDYNGPPTAYPMAPAQAAGIAQRAGADVALSFDLSHADGQTTFDILCHDAASAAPACRVHETTAAGPGALPELMSWLAMQVVHDLSARPRTSAPPFMAATLAPPRPASPPRERVLTFGARAAIMLPVSSAGTDTELLAGIGVLAALDSGYVLSTVGIELAAGNANHMRSLGLGLFAPLAADGLVPFVGASGLWVDQQLGGQGATGFQLRPTLGLLWGRHDVAKMRLELAYFVDLFQERGLDRLSPGADDGHYAHGVTLSAGATF